MAATKLQFQLLSILGLAISFSSEQLGEVPPYEIVVVQNTGNFYSVQCRVVNFQSPLTNAVFYHDGNPEGTDPCLPHLSTQDSINNLIVTPACDGFYFCGREYEGGLVLSSPYPLFSILEPTLKTPITMTVCEGDTVRLNSSFEHSDFVEVYWTNPTLDGFEPVSNGKYNPCDFSYTIYDVSESDSEVYIPRANNPVVSTFENGASTNLRVLPKPRMIEMEYLNGEVRVNAESVMRYQWKINGELQPEVTGNKLVLDSDELVPEDNSGQKVEVEVTLHGECGASITWNFIILKEVVEATPTNTPTTCNNQGVLILALEILCGGFLISTVAISAILFACLCKRKSFSSQGLSSEAKNGNVQYYRKVPNRPSVSLSFGKDCSGQDLKKSVSPIVSILHETVAIMWESDQSDFKVLYAVESLLTHVLNGLDESETIRARGHIMEIKEFVHELSNSLAQEQFSRSRGVLSSPVVAPQADFRPEQETHEDEPDFSEQPRDIVEDGMVEYHYSYSAPDGLTEQEKVRLMKASIAGMLKVVDDKCSTMTSNPH